MTKQRGSTARGVRDSGFSSESGRISTDQFRIVLISSHFTSRFTRILLLTSGLNMMKMIKMIEMIEMIETVR
jgi:hypothetical protein